MSSKASCSCCSKDCTCDNTCKCESTDKCTCQPK
ncbi:unnamed protein product [Candida parapsilosis]|uniref:Metallothionein n=1 Tax=Candida parapsilosis (strain CDC 317 / ATCC MYA-4646) TaxID=578454 RepID=G8B6F8_CANPC|nr:uncharacterized protein CPAR2_100770 [Candida parapsilosis]CAD1809387.1 unnamed protein product [Candida parapsilosis]CCE40039.1 hypothetical protein CPAR2_100770 [Candida parapsilosis]